jgi:hypothetical protein
MKSNTKKVQSILHMCHMDQHSEERRKVGWQTPKSTLKGAIVPPFDKYNFFKPQCPHLFNHQIPNFQEKKILAATLNLIWQEDILLPKPIHMNPESI